MVLLCLFRCYYPWKLEESTHGPFVSRINLGPALCSGVMCRPPTQEKPPMPPPADGPSGAEQPDAAMKGPAATCHRQIHLEIIPRITKRQERTRIINEHQYNYKQ